MGKKNNHAQKQAAASRKPPPPAEAPGGAPHVDSVTAVTDLPPAKDEPEEIAGVEGSTEGEFEELPPFSETEKVSEPKPEQSARVEAPKKKTAGVPGKFRKFNKEKS